LRAGAKLSLFKKCIVKKRIFPPVDYLWTNWFPSNILKCNEKTWQERCLIEKNCFEKDFEQILIFDFRILCIFISTHPLIFWISIFVARYTKKDWLEWYERQISIAWQNTNCWQFSFETRIWDFLTFKSQKEKKF